MTLIDKIKALYMLAGGNQVEDFKICLGMPKKLLMDKKLTKLRKIKFKYKTEIRTNWIINKMKTGLLFQKAIK